MNALYKLICNLFAAVLFISLLSFTDANAVKLKSGNINIKFNNIRKVYADDSMVFASFDKNSGAMDIKFDFKDFVYNDTAWSGPFQRKYLDLIHFPTTSISASITDYKKLNLSKPGPHVVNYYGSILFNGQKTEFNIKGMLNTSTKTISGRFGFDIELRRHRIIVPNDELANIGTKMHLETEVIFPAK